MSAIAHISQTALPRRELRPFIQAYGQRNISVPNATISHPLLPCLGPVLSFDLADLSKLHFDNGASKTASRIQLFGSHSSMKIEARFQGTFLEFGIFLKPFACWQLFRIPPANFTEAEFDAEDVFGRWIQEIWMRLAECRTFPERVSTADRCLLPFALHAGPLSRAMRAGKVLLHAPASSTIEQIAFDSALSVRTFGRTFSAEIGITPRLFARVARFQRAIDLKRESGESWLTVAHESGYFDQMHMVRDFREIGGRAPSQLIQSIGDAQPWSLGAQFTRQRVSPNLM